MNIERCKKEAKSRVSFVCLRAADLRKGKTVEEMSQHDAFIKANKEAKRFSW